MQPIDPDTHDPLWTCSVDDDTWFVRVFPTDHQQGRLQIIHLPTSWLAYETAVPLAYGALFGPDVDDVANWQHLVIDWIDQDGTDAVSHAAWNKPNAITATGRLQSSQLVDARDVAPGEDSQIGTSTTHTYGEVHEDETLP
jgi:hypothetical protein